MPTVSFRHKKISFKGEKSLLEEQGFNYPSSCLNGTCGACAIKVTPSEAFSPPSAIERQTLQELGFDPSIRLSCRMRVLDSPHHIKLEDFTELN